MIMLPGGFDVAVLLELAHEPPFVVVLTSEADEGEGTGRQLK